MPVQVSCSACAKNFRVGDQFAGKKIRCPNCKQVIAVPHVEPVAVDEREEMDAWEQSSNPIATPTRGLTPGRTERTYVHLKCGGETTLDGPYLKATADPLASMLRTVCASCEDYFPIEEFSWSDTQENIAKYYQRYQSQVSPLSHFCASRGGMFTLAGAMVVFGIIGVFVFKTIWMVLVGLLLGVVAVVLHTVVVGPMILKFAFGTSDARELN